MMMMMRARVLSSHLRRIAAVFVLCGLVCVAIVILALGLRLVCSKPFFGSKV